MDYNIDNEDFEDLIQKYLDGEITIEELKKLVSYYESFQKTNSWVEELGPENLIKNKMLNNILEAIQDVNVAEVKVVPFYKKPIVKYAVAASLALFFSIQFILNNEKIENVESVKVNNNIKEGTDKAILTLENGEKIVLEKGKEYNSNIVRSNGKDLIYQSKETIEKKLAFNYLTIPRGGQYHVVLSDGTEVWLNSESQLKYPVSFTDGQLREVELVYGEAYFDVSHSTEHKGSKFKVLTKNQEIEVLGTEFNINAYTYENEIYTTLVKGKVAVANGKFKSILSPNQQAIVKGDNEILITEADVFSATSWKKGIFSFEGLPLEEIMKVLSRWYDFEVEFSDPKIKEQNFTGVLRKNQNIEEILKIIKTINNISYEIDNKKIILK